jgi:multisubunit Na+/H+ antiporter MnhB subunit
VVLGKDGEVVHSIGNFVVAGAGAWGLVLVLFLLWWRPHLGITGGATGAAFFVGLLMSYSYYANMRKKEQYQQVVSGSSSC